MRQAFFGATDLWGYRRSEPWSATESAIGDGGEEDSFAGLARVPDGDFDACIQTVEHGLLQHYLR